MHESGDMERLDLSELVKVFGSAPVGKAAGGVNVGPSRMGGHSSVCKKLYAWARIYKGNCCYIRVHSTGAGQVLDLIKADSEAAHTSVYV